MLFGIEVIGPETWAHTNITVWGKRHRGTVTKDGHLLQQSRASGRQHSQSHIKNQVPKCKLCAQCPS